MPRTRRFWQESDSSVTPEDSSVARADDARGRQRMIGAELRHWYDKIAKEPVPDDWLDLLSQSESRRDNARTEQSESAGSK
jgi:hypothetical protein